MDKDNDKITNSGWIKLHRSIEKHWIWSNSIYLQTWICILLEVNHECKKVVIDGELLRCERGQSVNSLRTWVGLFGKGWTIQKVRTFFKLLEKDEMIITEGLRKTTRLTVCNYSKYQDSQHADNSEKTARKHTGNIQKTTNKNRKNIKNLKNTNNDAQISIQFIDFINQTLMKNYKCDKIFEDQFSLRIKEGRTIEELKKVVINFSKEPFHIESHFKHLTPDFLTRDDKVNKGINLPGHTHSLSDLKTIERIRNMGREHLKSGSP